MLFLNNLEKKQNIYLKKQEKVSFKSNSSHISDKVEINGSCDGKFTAKEAGINLSKGVLSPL